MSRLAPGGPAWRLAVCVSRVGAVVSVVLLHRTPAAAALHGPAVPRAAVSAGVR